MNLPKQFTDRMKSMLGDDFEAFIKSYEEKKTAGLRVNTLKIDVNAFLKIFPHELRPVQWCETGFYYDPELKLGQSPYHCAGLFYIQEPSAMSVVEALGIKTGDRVLDLCAAPGGKSTHAASKLAGSGVLVSNEIDSGRSLVLAENLERMGVKNVVVLNMPPDKLCGYFESFFDKIIVDAPCSGEGMFRKNPAAVREWSVEHSLSCAKRQSLILHSASKMLKEGGRLVYSTCTFSRCENEDVVERFLDSNKDFALVKHERFFPHTHEGEGHFLAVIERLRGETRDIKHVGKNADASLYKEFEKQYMKNELDGDFSLFGGRLYLKPRGIGSLDGLKAVRAGLFLGEIKKGRLEPSHALCMAQKKEDFLLSVNFPADSKEVRDYLRGEAQKADIAGGWGAFCVEGYPLGWFKSTGGVLKNHYPKSLRF